MIGLILLYCYNVSQTNTKFQCNLVWSSHTQQLYVKLFLFRCVARSAWWRFRWSSMKIYSRINPRIRNTSKAPSASQRKKELKLQKFLKIWILINLKQMHLKSSNITEIHYTRLEIINLLSVRESIAYPWWEWETRQSRACWASVMPTYAKTPRPLHFERVQIEEPIVSLDPPYHTTQRTLLLLT